jgi:hypothetical protein
MEEPVRERVGFQPCDRVHRPVVRAGNHVVPLEELVEDDAVYESPEAETEDDSRSSDAPSRRSPGDSVALRHSHARVCPGAVRCKTYAAIAVALDRSCARPTRATS